MEHDKTKKSVNEMEASAGTEAEVILLLHVIEQGMQSLLLRDKYLRILIAVQTAILLYLLIK